MRGPQSPGEGRLGASSTLASHLRAREEIEREAVNMCQWVTPHTLTVAPSVSDLATT